MGQLYKLDFPNGKAYIGITTKTADARLKGHERALLLAKPNGPVLYRAWRKYGTPTMTVLAIVEDADLYETEKRAIAVFGALYPGGYNLTDGGEAGFSHHHETRTKISSANLGRKHSYEARAKISEASKNISQETRAKRSYALRGKKRSDETRAKMSAAKRGTKPSKEAIEKAADANRGNKRSDETRAKMSAAARAVWVARKAKNDTAE